jgi:hypothetical protein
MPLRAKVEGLGFPGFNEVGGDQCERSKNGRNREPDDKTGHPRTFHGFLNNK